MTSTGEITQLKNDIDAYDDKVVDLRGEDPLFIPKPYRNEKEEEKVTKSSATIAGKNRVSFTTFPQIAPVHPTVYPPVRPSQPLPRKEFLLKSTPLPRIITHQQLSTRTSFRPKTNSQTSFLVSRLPQLVKQPQQLRTNLIAPTSTTISPHPTETVPIIPHAQSSQPSSQIGLPSQSHSTSNSLRTGVCHASIFYISTPMQNPKKHLFTHFAITVSTDQCARTCHEFNCAIAHYDPVTGRCQFNPSTAFAIRKGQCPPWPATHYKNNIQTNTPLRIFCVQCHRIRRGRVGNQGRFRTAVLRTLYTRRLPSSLQSSGLARMHSVLSKQPGVIMGSSFSNITSTLKGRKEQIDSGQNFIDDTGHHWDRSKIEMEAKNNSWFICRE
uniref:Apple domain-containing protein n=1 Tax=Wuchereria bancrofti TaxID=6293 RepID=A0A1I8EBP4_WUCBA